MPTATSTNSVARQAMSERRYEDFWEHLLLKYALATGDPLKRSLGTTSISEKNLRVLWERSKLPVNAFADEVASFWDLTRISLHELLGSVAPLGKFSRRFLRETTVFPLQSADGFKLAMADPTDQAAIRAVEIVFGGPVSVVIASFEDIATALAERQGEDDGDALKANEEIQLHSDEDIDSLRDLASGAPVVRALNDLFERAMEMRASDIHVEPFRTGLMVRMRVDGLMRPVPAQSGILPQALVSRIKILAGLNIAERRLPQDGAARLRIGRSEIDIRVATMPTQHGETAVLRLLPKDRGIINIAKLGLSTRDEATMGRLLALPHGMIIVTGPTGSGKTTTLAAMLSVLNQTTRKILTIEDPIEYEIPGVNQSQVKPSIGLTFASALRAFVRQDPDIIMVGEVRDAETAHIAIHAALTGHLVLTTLHTETAAAAVPRLLDMNVEGFLLRSTLRASIAQRLVRLLCDRCKVVRTLDAADIGADPRYTMLGFKPGEILHEPAGCEHCGGTGYRGRSGVFEILEMTSEIRDLIARRADATLIDETAVRGGMTTMIGNAMAKCRTGETSVAEVLRVTTIR
jgi:general secretion pathway protein E